MPESLADMALLDERLGEASSPLEAPLERLCALCFASDARFALMASLACRALSALISRIAIPT